LGWCVSLGGSLGVPIKGGPGFSASGSLCAVVTGKGDVAVLTGEAYGPSVGNGWGLSGGGTGGPMFSTGQSPYDQEGPFDWHFGHLGPAELDASTGSGSCGQPIVTTYGGEGPSTGIATGGGKSMTQVWMSTGSRPACGGGVSK
jgi:hypothetical protein